MSTDTIIDRIYSENSEILNYLDSQKEYSFKSNCDEKFTKTLVLSISSYFEHCITELILEFSEKSSSNNAMLISLIKSKAISRQYHTYFGWEGKNANSFFACFGQEFKTECEREVKQNKELEEGIQNFLSLGNTRNQLVHINFANYSLDKNSSEYFAMYKKALIFIQFLKNKLSFKTEKKIES